MIKLNKTYHIIVIICVAAALVAIKMLTYKSTPPAKMESSTNIILVDGRQVENALCESCKLSGNKLTSGPEIINEIMKDVDPAALKDITNKSIVFYKKDGYLEIPATLIANMIELKLFAKPNEIY